jgi:hypothetical protein
MTMLTLSAILMPLVIVIAGILVRFAFASVAGKPLALSDGTSVVVKPPPGHSSPRYASVRTVLAPTKTW